MPSPPWCSHPLHFHAWLNRHCLLLLLLLVILPLLLLFLQCLSISLAVDIPYFPSSCYTIKKQYHIRSAVFLQVHLVLLSWRGPADTKKLNSRKMLDENGIEKASLTQYVMWGWQEKLLFTENARQGWYKKSFNLIF